MGVAEGSERTGRTLPPRRFGTEALSPSTRGSEWPLAGHSRAPRIAVRRRTHLQAEIEGSRLRAWKRLDRLWERTRHPERLRGDVGIGLLDGIAAPLPRDERPAGAQERRGVLDEDPERRECTRRHDVMTARSLRPSLRARVDDAHV